MGRIKWFNLVREKKNLRPLLLSAVGNCTQSRKYDILFKFQKLYKMDFKQEMHIPQNQVISDRK